MRSLLALAAIVLSGCVTAAAAPRPADDGRPPPAIRGPAGQIELRTLDGAPTTLAAYGARVTVIALWATYCGPCLDELPHIEALHRMYRGRSDVSVIAVNVEDTSEPGKRAEVRGLLQELAMRETPCLLGSDAVMERLTARDQDGQPRMEVPLLVVVDAAFRIHRRFGFAPSTSRGEYLAEKSALIEAALRGDEPQGPPPAAL
jgi:thiol-disulfide isomerase/thioredoxin